MIDLAKFRIFEHAGWEHAVQPYADAFGSLTIQAVEPLLDAAGVASGTRVLDVACGPGWAAEAAAERGARAIGVDFSAAMVASAARTYPSIEFREGDAEELPFRESEFDAVIMNFGLLYLPRPEQAMREAHRVLRVGGRFAFTVWAPPEEAVVFGMVLRAVEKYGKPSGRQSSGRPARTNEVAGLSCRCRRYWRQDASVSRL